jgi:uncharacterized protein with LGFP repeats
VAALSMLAALLTPTSAQAATGDAEIQARWQALENSGASLGAAKDVPYTVADGRAQDFANGSIFWSAATNAWEVLPPVLDTYVTAQHGPAGPLGFPTAPAGALAAPAGASSQPFTGGTVYASPTTGAHAVRGAVLDRYTAAGGPAGTLGLPTSDVAAAAGRPGSLVGSHRRSHRQGRHPDPLRADRRERLLPGSADDG